MQGLMELVHLATRIKLVPSLKDGNGLTEIERKRAVPLADKVPLPNLGRLYQLLMQGVQEVKQAERPYEALAMACVRMAYLTPLPSMDKLVAQAQGVVESVASQPVQVSLSAMAAQMDEPRNLPVLQAGLMESEKEIQSASVSAEVHDWAGVVKMVRTTKPALAAGLERQVRCVSFADTKLELAIDRGLLTAPDLLRDLRNVMRELTGVMWDIREVAGAGGEGVNLAKVAAEADAVRKTEAATDPLIADVLGMFPGAELESVEHPDNY
jgi:DNA polymerase-3 subunit gamma/tau